MASFSDKLENALNEGRILILGAQVLVGFGFRSIFQEGFPRLPDGQQQLWMWSLGLMLGSLCLLILPVPFHYIAESGEPTLRLHRLAQRMIEVALVPFAIGMAVYIFIATDKTVRSPWAIALALLILGCALFFWYALPAALARRRRAPKKSRQHGGQMELAERVKKVLIEARMVLPGVQALLGFQFAIVLMDSFEQLPGLWQGIHLAALALMSIAVCLLLAPAAYHRIVLQGEDSEELVRVASRFVLASLIPLGLAIAAEFGLVVWMVVHSDILGFVGAFIVALFLFTVWFGWTMWVRRSRTTATAS
jgi:MFS family permease